MPRSRFNQIYCCERIVETLLKSLITKKQLSPQEKKLLSYKKDCRNMVAESRSKSRFAIAKRRAIGHQAFRHAEKQILDQLHNISEEIIEEVEVKVDKVKKKRWRKVSDSPLGEFVAVQLNTRQNRGINANLKESNILRKAQKQCLHKWILRRW